MLSRPCPQGPGSPGRKRRSAARWPSVVLSTLSVVLLSLSRLADSYRSANVSAFRRIALRNRHPAVSARCSHLGVQRIAFSSFVQKVAFRRRRYGVPHARPSVDRNAVSRECSNCAAGAVLLGAAATRAGPRKLMVAGGVRQSGAVLQPSLRGPSA
jgi:hypothetical protein